MKCWNSAFNAQGSRIIIAPAEALKEKERQDETQFITKIGGKTSLGPSSFIL
jgi:hypothetical protein